MDITNIASAAYGENGRIAVVMNDGSVFSVPDDHANPARRKLDAWTAEGNTISPYVAPPPPVPQTVTMAQARIALAQVPGSSTTLLADVEALVAGANDPVLTTAWEYAPTVSRTGALVTGFAAQLGLDDAALDALFTAAGAIEL